MGLESMQVISDLNPDWPLSTDLRRQGDDHLRGIKRALRNTFPNINAAVTATDETLNGIPANLTAILAELVEHIVPRGTIAMWHSALGSIPTGWSLCDGSTVVGYGATPDMRNRFVVGAGSDYVADTVGGADTKNSGDGGGHTPVAGGTALAANQIPSHDHRLLTWETGSSSDANNFSTVNSQGLAGNVGGTYAYRLSTTVTAGNTKLVENAGTAAATHTHVMDAVAAHNHTIDVRPRYYVVVFIVKTMGYVP